MIRFPCLFLALLLSALAISTAAQAIPDSSHSDPILQKLLSQPSGMVADITLTDGTLRKSTDILRVTTDFVVVGGSCENIEVAKIAKVKWVRMKNHIPGEGLSPGDWWLVPMLPIFLALDSTTRFKESHRPMFGSSESVNARPDGSVDRVQLRYGNNIGTVVVSDGWVYQESAFIRTGRYHAENGALHLEFDHTDAPVEDFRFRIKCDQLIVEPPNLMYFTLLWQRQDRTYPPLVG